MLAAAVALSVICPEAAYAEEGELWADSVDSGSVIWDDYSAENPEGGEETISYSETEPEIPAEPVPEITPEAETPAAEVSTESSSAESEAAPGTEDTAAQDAAASSSASSETAEEEEEPEEEEEMEQEASEEAIELIPEIRAFYSNEDLLAAQNIVHLTLEAQMDSLFEQTGGSLMFAGKDTYAFEQMNLESAKVGRFSEGDAVYILSYEIEGWVYVESGSVRGFMKEEDLVRGEDVPDRPDEEDFTCGEQLVSPIDNNAWAYRLISVHETTIFKEYIFCREGTVNILEEPDLSARAIGEMPSNSIAFLIEDVGDGWYYVESGAVRGFLESSLVETGIEVNAAVSASGEQAYSRAKQLVSPAENRARYYSVASVYANGGLNPVRSEICEEAANYLGNPYVWGGTSLTDGADCSGFVQTLFSMFGYELPRVAESQSMTGTQIPVEDALPGDLIFFAQDGYVYHVALYIGDGMDIEAYGTSVGIIVNDVDMGNAVWATRVIED